MAKADWGIKRTCQSCGARFYDLKKDPVICPKCSATFSPESILRSRRRLGADDEKEIKGGKRGVVYDDTSGDMSNVADDILIEDDIGADDDAPFIEDTDELGDDDVASDIEAPSKSKIE